jgi:ABC-type glycerol-3-phosphate transport system permease component
MARSTTQYSQKFSHSRGGNLLNFLILLAIAIFMVIPFLFTVGNAFKPLDEQFVYPPTIFPRVPTIQNFLSVSSLMRESWVPFARYLFNSVFITVVGTFFHVIVSSLGAYAVAKFEFPGKKVFFEMVVVSLLFNGSVTAIPNYLIMSKLGMIDTLLAIILPAIGSSLGFFLMKQFMEQMIPDAMIEAAQIDGANGWTIFMKIVMPMVKPAWLTLIIFSFQNLWNNTGGSFIFTENLKTLPNALSNIVAGGVARTGSAAAVALIMVIPPVVVFIISQSNVIETMGSSGLKE